MLSRDVRRIQSKIVCTSNAEIQAGGVKALVTSSRSTALLPPTPNTFHLQTREQY